MLSLNVKYRTGFDPKPMEFKQDALIRDVITMIVSKHDLPLHYPYVLFNPQADPTTEAGWLRPDHETTLYSTTLRNSDVVELLCEPAPLHISRLDEKERIDLTRISFSVLNATKKTGMLDFSEPLYKLLPAWVKYFPYKKKKKQSNYCILRLSINENYAQVVGMLNVNISPSEANLGPNGHLLLCSLEYFNRPASSVLNPTYVGYATIKIRKGENKYTKAKKYLLVQKYNILYYFSSRSSLSSEGMIDLQYMNVSTKNLEVRLSLTNKFGTGLLAPVPDYVLETDVHNIKELVRRVWRHSASGAGKHVFGVSLAHLWDRKFSVDLPVVVTSCCEYISKYGINTEGVFQDPGTKETMEMLRDEFDKGGPVDMDELNPDPHSVGQLLKQYLMELAEPILTYSLYGEFWKVRNNTNNVMMMLSSLPSQNQLLVKFLSTFFLEFVRHAAANRITLHGLALYFIPCFLRPKDDQVAHDASMMSSVLTTLIANCESFVPMQRIRSLSKASRMSMEITRASMDMSNFSPPFPLQNRDTPPSTPPPRYSLRLEQIQASRAEIRREPSNPTLMPPLALSTPPASPSPTPTKPNPPSVPPSPISPPLTASSSSRSLASSSSSRSLGPSASSRSLVPSASYSNLALDAPPPPSTPASSSLSPPSTPSTPPSDPIPTTTLSPPPALPPTRPTSLPPDLPPAPSPTLPRPATPPHTKTGSEVRLSPSLPRPVFVLPPSPNTIRRLQGLTAPDASAPPASKAAYAAAAAIDAAADARAAALAALAALDFLDKGLTPPGSPSLAKHGSVALGAPPPLPTLDSTVSLGPPPPLPQDPPTSLPPDLGYPPSDLPPPTLSDFGSSPPSDFRLGTPPPPPPSP